jgi:hypothetical protein
MLQSKKPSRTAANTGSKQPSAMMIAAGAMKIQGVERAWRMGSCY